MADESLVRNSRLLGLFTEIVQGPEATLRAVEAAGRGIAAGALLHARRICRQADHQVRQSGRAD
ncbi:hypothetical protein [Micromonospora sp. WMMD1155]|uniref:hypothetical protein n=1 Tax=Micromonospora sp. WMMD1155 TaxID=3016094 RepID=UPI002499EB65|nr:hypothetical protein [Micromonospora sp. WMMD1155]WFE50998.1 hypothetical protein O7617_11960 [Micromonospora sp. WMMD1155]